jgi:hypothetical protein
MNKKTTVENETQTLYDVQYDKHWKTWKMKNAHCRTWNMLRKLTNNNKKKENHVIGPGLWRETWQTRKMRNSHGTTWNMERNNEKLKIWETQTVGPSIWQQNWKTLKMSHNHWNIARNTEKWLKWAMYSVGHGLKRENWKTCKIRHTHNIGPGIWRETVKNMKYKKYSL